MWGDCLQSSQTIASRPGMQCAEVHVNVHKVAQKNRMTQNMACSISTSITQHNKRVNVIYSARAHYMHDRVT